MSSNVTNPTSFNQTTRLSKNVTEGSNWQPIVASTSTTTTSEDISPAVAKGTNVIYIIACSVTITAIIILLPIVIHQLKVKFRIQNKFRRLFGRNNSVKSGVNSKALLELPPKAVMWKRNVYKPSEKDKFWKNLKGKMLQNDFKVDDKERHLKVQSQKMIIMKDMASLVWQYKVREMILEVSDEGDSTPTPSVGGSGRVQHHNIASVAMGAMAKHYRGQMDNQSNKPSFLTVTQTLSPHKLCDADLEMANGSQLHCKNSFCNIPIITLEGKLVSKETLRISAETPSRQLITKSFQMMRME